MNKTREEMTQDVTLAPGLPQAIEHWRVARREAQMWPTREATGLYCEATDLLARALLGDIASEPDTQAIFERLHAWLVKEEEPA
jgi:hypothetical protein